MRIFVENWKVEVKSRDYRTLSLDLVCDDEAANELWLILSADPGKGVRLVHQQIPTDNVTRIKQLLCTHRSTTCDVCGKKIKED